MIFKLLERLVARQFVAYLNATRLLPTTQSGFRRGHSTETAIIRVLSDLLDAVDRDDTAILVLLDLSAAFDTVDHGILLERLRVTFGVELHIENSKNKKVKLLNNTLTFGDVLLGNITFF